jgi:hypothetical protein
MRQHVAVDETGSRPVATAATDRNAFSAMRRKHSSVRQSECGVTMTVSSVRIGLSRGVGSSSNTSSVAPAIVRCGGIERHVPVRRDAVLRDADRERAVHRVAPYKDAVSPPST